MAGRRQAAKATSFSLFQRRCAYLLGGGAWHDRRSAPLLVPAQADSSQRFFTNSQDVRDRHNEPQKSKRRRVDLHLDRRFPRRDEVRRIAANIAKLPGLGAQ